jgi:hypothetical protein
MAKSIAPSPPRKVLVPKDALLNSEHLLADLALVAPPGTDDKVLRAEASRLLLAA